MNTFAISVVITIEALDIWGEIKCFVRKGCSPNCKARRVEKKRSRFGIFDNCQEIISLLCPSVGLYFSIPMKKVGVAAIKRKKDENAKFLAVGKAMEETKLSFVKETIGKFKTSLENFAIKYREQINSDPEFRLRFHTMCRTAGVDPLSSSKGFWSEILGIGDFYFELGVIIVQICLQTRPQNGGIISLSELLFRVQTSRKSSETRRNTTEEDIKRAVEKLSILGSGFRLIELRGNTMIQSVPLETNRDHEQILNEAQETGFVTKDSLGRNLGWNEERIQLSLSFLIRQELIWIDDNRKSIDSTIFLLIFRLISKLPYMNEDITFRSCGRSHWRHQDNLSANH